jgi:predicted acylesterase/phospholipase RssA
LARRRGDKRKRSKVALVCAGGGVTGAVYEIGCLRALEEVLDRSVADLDLYVGISGGAFVNALLAHGISPVEIYDEVVSRSAAPFGVAAAPLYRLGATEFVKRSLRAPEVVGRAVWTALTGEGRNLADLAFGLLELLPAGLLDTSGIRDYLHGLLKSRGRRDRFDDLRRELYVVAVDLDQGEAVAFGEKGHRDVPISTAVQASTALPGLYRPVRIGGRDYVDGGVRKTAHINLAIRHGADLVICINPLVPIRNDAARGPLGGHLSRRGITYVLDQVLRIVLHGRMAYGLERYRKENPEVDIVVIEPTRSDLRMFSYNLMRYSARRVLAEHGYETTLLGLRARKAHFARLFAKHGLRLSDPDQAPLRPAPGEGRSRLARSLAASLDRLERALGPASRRKPSAAGRAGRRPSSGRSSARPRRAG